MRRLPKAAIVASFVFVVATGLTAWWYARHPSLTPEQVVRVYIEWVGTGSLPGFDFTGVGGYRGSGGIPPPAPPPCPPAYLPEATLVRIGTANTDGEKGIVPATFVLTRGTDGAREVVVRFHVVRQGRGWVVNESPTIHGDMMRNAEQHSGDWGSYHGSPIAGGER